MLQQLWTSLTGSLSNAQLFALSYPAFVITYWVSGLTFLAIDLLQPHWVAYFKCQPKKHVNTAEIRKCVINIVTNQLTTYPIFFLMLWPIANWRFSFAKELPPFTTVLWSIPAYALVTEVMFYYGHRAAHIPALYKRFHKKHHEIKAPFGICAIYFHPVEHVQTVVEAIAPALVFGSHISVSLLWTVMATFTVVVHHCGYDFEPYWPDSLRPFFASMTQQHDYHHFAFDKCFGVLGILDWIHGTDIGLPEHLLKWENERAPKVAMPSNESNKKSE